MITGHVLILLAVAVVVVIIDLITVVMVLDLVRPDPDPIFHRHIYGQCPCPSQTSPGPDPIAPGIMKIGPSQDRSDHGHRCYCRCGCCHHGYERDDSGGLFCLCSLFQSIIYFALFIPSKIGAATFSGKFSGRLLPTVSITLSISPTILSII